MVGSISLPIHHHHTSRCPQHPHHNLLWSPAHCTMQKNIMYFVSIRLSLPTHVPFVTP